MAENKREPDFSNVQSGGSSAAPSPLRHNLRPAHIGRERRHALEDRQKYYGDANKWRKIYEANTDSIKNPDVMHPGRVFKIPEA